MLQVIKDLLDHYRVFNAGDDFHGAAAAAAGLDVDIGVLGFFRPKTTIIAESPAIRGLQEGIAFSEVHIYTNFG